MNTKRAPYFIQIGFDFGTAFSKCIYRDVGADRAFIFHPKNTFDHQNPFLIPVLLKYQNNKAVDTLPTDGFHSDEHLSLLKMALLNVASKNYEDITVRRCKKVFSCKIKQLGKRIEAATAHYLAHRFVEIDSTIKNQFKGYGSHSDDSIFLNVAIPVANASEEKKCHTFERVIRAAWNDRTEIVKCDGDLGAIAQRINITSDRNNPNEGCYLYPEVSANVQAYVRSRTSQPGIYLFVDTGAGTVDQSVFIYSNDGRARLAYLSADVSPLGSSQIEIRALKKRNGTSDLEQFRQEKESGRLQSTEIQLAIESITNELHSPSHRSLGLTYTKGVGTPQIKEIKIIYGGGGHLNNPYASGVRMGINEFFSQRDDGGGHNGDGYTPPFNPDDIPDMGIPIPNDLEFENNGQANQWFKRLSVAYGLSYPQFDLADYKLPNEIKDSVPLKKGRLVGHEYIEN